MEYYAPSDWYTLEYNNQSISVANITSYLYLDKIGIPPPNPTYYFYSASSNSISGGVDNVDFSITNTELKSISLLNETRIYSEATGIPLYLENTQGDKGWIDLSGLNLNFTSHDAAQTVTSTKTTTVTEQTTKTFNTTSPALDANFISGVVVIALIPTIRRKFRKNEKNP